MGKPAGSSVGARRGTPATVALVRAGVEFTVHSYDHDPAVASYGEEAVAALGVDAARVLKTLVAAVDGDLVVACLPVGRSLDLKALAAAVGGKRAELADPTVAERVTGYVRDGISPLGQRRALPTVLDGTAAGAATVFVSGGRRGLELELAPGELAQLTGAVSATITRFG